MAIQEIQRKGNIFGQLGKALGQGLSEQLPKEIERQRLSQGLKNLNQQEDLTNQQYFTESLGVPGIIERPEVVRQLGELARQKSMRNAYARRATGEPPQISQAQPGQSINDVRFANFPENAPNLNQSSQHPRLVSRSETGQPQVVETNPLRPEALPAKRWSEQKYRDTLNQNAQQFPYASDEELKQITSAQEKREMDVAESEQERDKYKKEVRKEVEDEFKKFSELKLQKTGEGTFKDITGEMQSDILRTVERDIAENPKKSVRDAVNDRTNQMLDFVKSKKSLDELANTGIQDKINPRGREDAFKRLKSYSRTFDKVDRNEELYNKLKTTSLENGFGMSSQGAASIAFPIKNHPELQKYIDNTSSINLENSQKQSRMNALNIEKYLNDPKVSILSIMKALSDKHPFFDKRAFMDQLIEDRDNGKINPWPIQDREFEQGIGDIFPNWGDLWILPILR